MMISLIRCKRNKFLKYMQLDGSSESSLNSTIGISIEGTLQLAMGSIVQEIDCLREYVSVDK